MIQALKQFAFVVLLGCFSNLCKAEKVYDFTPTCKKAYEEITCLKIKNGEELIKQARQENPDNLIPDFLSSYVDFFVLFLNEDPDEYKDRKPHFDDYLTALADGPESSPFNKYCRAVVSVHKAAVAIKFGERWSAGWDFKKGFGLIKDNKKSFPDFAPNDLIYGPLQVAAGTIPNGYKWLTNLMGMKGSIKEGMINVRKFLNSNDPWAKLFYNEGVFYYLYLLSIIENEPDQALQYIRDKKLDVVNNQLFTYVTANLSINNKQTEYGKNVILNRNQSADYLSTTVWDFELGYAKLRHLEMQDATKYFENFLRSFKGRFYVKDGYEKLSWCYYLLGNMTAAENARQAAIKKGATDTDADKKAMKDAKSGVWPNQILLKARLLSDGGYDKEALVLLDGKNSDSFSKPEDKLEFAYRVARIYDGLGKDSAAIQAYLAAIKLGEKRTEYFAARAALQIGNIYEKQGKKALAIAFYQQCLDMDDHEYKDSLDQKAKAGIGRCKGQ
ncbi:MAG: hypothetical protein J0I41_19830 [Filimonas sp.]|nr:hypothetical protein [Filimonas sp.]